MKFRKAMQKAGATVEYRQMFAVGELFIADAWSPPPHENFARFFKRTGMCENMAKSYPSGVFVTIWWLETRDGLGVPSGIAVFEPNHDFGLSGKKQMRVNYAMDQAVNVMNDMHKQKTFEKLHVH